MKSLFGIGWLLMLAGACLLVAFALIGSTVNVDGGLNEPFPLLPIG
jgi:hypothetical protein